MSESGRDIGEMPEVVDPVRKEKAKTDFKYYCEVYHPETFCLGWSDDHLTVIARIERCVLEGGLFALAMPRGMGKTSLCETAAEWVLLYGHIDFVALVGSDKDSAVEMLDSIKSEIENNEHLLADFPEVCFPVQALEGINQRAKGQLYKGKLTRISWKGDSIALPSIEGSAASGGIIKVAGITGRVRGMKFKRPDGRQARPSMAIIDDPQTDESAKSPSQCKAREEVVAKAILGLTGPGGKPIAALMPCTVIQPGDMADKLLDRSEYPDWQGERMKLVYEFPTNMGLWDEYAKVREESFGQHGDIRDATAFYLKNRKAMDKGAKVAWDERFEAGEASAIQNAMNLFIRNPISFWSEYQNEPLPETEIDAEAITVDMILEKTRDIKSGRIPLDSEWITAGIDVQGKVLYWQTIAWSSEFTGTVLDYGAYPDPKRKYFTLREIKKTLRRAHPGAGLEGAIYAGLDELTKSLMDREWVREDGDRMKIVKGLIDANWGESTDVVYQFAAESVHRAIFSPSHGKGYGAAIAPMSEYKKKRGDQIGNHWRIPGIKGKRTVRHMLIDTNYWKSMLHERISVMKGDPGCLYILGKESEKEKHRMLAEHLTGEHKVRVEAKGRKVDEWKPKPNQDNHFFDTSVLCAVGASMMGAKVFGVFDPANRVQEEIDPSKCVRERLR